ncbi:hypothetical protein [Chamaesiphon sp.]|uniref:hypothetical protein n=1 Tax=Chamaesiphon sp. TaxID=2814140 RepID=UPI00359397C4
MKSTACPSLKVAMGLMTASGDRTERLQSPQELLQIGTFYQPSSLDRLKIVSGSNLKIAVVKQPEPVKFHDPNQPTQIIRSTRS